MNLNREERFIVGLSWIWFGAGVLWITMGIFQSFIAHYSWLSVVGSAGVLVAHSLKRGDVFVVRWGLRVFALSFLAEVVGVNTGLLFGCYRYGSALGGHLLGVPPVIGIAWFFVVFSSFHLASALRLGGWQRIAATAFFTLLFDFVMEPGALRVGFWAWETVTIPLLNYFCWGAFGALFAWMLEEKAHAFHFSSFALHLLAAQFFFFFMIGLS